MLKHKHCLSQAAWVLFLIWTLIGFVVLPFHLDYLKIHGILTSQTFHSLSPIIPFIEGTITLFFSWGESVWVLLASLLIILDLIANQGGKTTLRWVIAILLITLIIELFNAQSGLPFGPITFTNKLGWKIGNLLPFTKPFLWLVIILSARSTVLSVLPSAKGFLLALGVGTLALFTDFNLELVAWKEQGYWIWYPYDKVLNSNFYPPWQNFLSWFVLTFCIAWLLTLLSSKNKNVSEFA